MLGLTNPASAQLLLLSEDFSSGIPATWAVLDADGLSPHSDVASFTDGWIYYEDTDSSASSTSYYDPSGQSEDYLILPKLSLLAATKLVWSGRSVDASWPDSYLVLLSTTDSLPASFTDTLLEVTNESYLWQTYSILLDTAGFASQDVYIAFRNHTTDGFILQLDDIKVFSDDNVGVDLIENVKSSIYPNPAVGLIRVQHNITGACHLICDLSGREMLWSATDLIDISALSSGTYLVRTQNGTQIAFSKFVVTD